jgi:hypothetical protein
MSTRDELVRAVAERYARVSKAERGRILDEFANVTGHHRKHAMRLLRSGAPDRRSAPRPERRLYDQAARDALILLWEASDRVCGKRLRRLLPILLGAMERHGHVQPAAEVKASLLAMSAASIRRSVPVRTFDGWKDPPPGFVEADLVAHSGPTSKGSFIQTLTLTDIATGWTECAPLLMREQNLLRDILTELRKPMPFALLGFDTDNDSVFMNETVQSYCNEGGIEFTRCRPYRKNDQAWVEQKNGSVVRHTVGYRRFESLEAAAALAQLYRSLRLFVNFFQPSFKLAEKARDGAKAKRRYHPPATPYQRLLADERTAEATRRKVTAMFATLDPVRLLRDIRRLQAVLVELADRPMREDGPALTVSTLEQFLSGLRTAWKEGEVRPTRQPKEKVKRGRRRPDPLIAVTPQLREWFEAEPWRSAGELFERLQSEHPGVYPDGQLRTFQRRVKTWRKDVAHKLVFGAAVPDAGATTNTAGSIQ